MSSLHCSQCRTRQCFHIYIPLQLTTLAPQLHWSAQTDQHCFYSLQSFQWSPCFQILQIFPWPNRSSPDICPLRHSSYHHHWIHRPFCNSLLTPKSKSLTSCAGLPSTHLYQNPWLHTRQNNGHYARPIIGFDYIFAFRVADTRIFRVCHSRISWYGLWPGSSNDYKIAAAFYGIFYMK